MRALVKLLALFAVLLLPLGMTPAAATATHHPMASMPMQHCPEQGSGHQSKTAFAACTMACSAALPALDRCAAQPLTVARERVRPSLAQQLSDLHPDIATPPPKRS
jgi:adenosylmethionine-8-amino-7-oxononanoate aminotransferase